MLGARIDINRQFNHPVSEGGFPGNAVPDMTVVHAGRRNAEFVPSLLRTKKNRVQRAAAKASIPVKWPSFQERASPIVKRLMDMPSSNLAQRAQPYPTDLSKTPIAGDIESFP